ncbi:MAG: 2-polyprenylphenol 6-hydroxylase [Proteobacteria bacterium]|nr:2-polyprenylphenol 6-hydroxylase [Pseudomonadota bacterium]
MTGAFRHGWRFLRVARTLARHDALFPMAIVGRHAPALRILRRLAALTVWPAKKEDGRPGERLAAALQDLGPAFIKLGQTMATRPDLVGEEIADDLTALQDRLSPFSAAEARATIETELGAPVDELFASFDDTPIAAASIAQVHLATDSDGNKVAVKILRPGIEEIFRRDLQGFLWLARLMERVQPDARRLRPTAIVETLTQSVEIEMDLRLEAAAASELRENMTGEAGYRVPQIDWQRTAQRVLTLEWIEGIPIRDKKAITKAGHDLSKISETIVRVFLTQAIRDGFFHGDLHQGNFFIEKDGTIVPVDFGIMGRLSRASRRYLAEILWGFQEGDYGHVADVHFEAGYVPRDQSPELFAQALRAIGEPIAGRPINEISLAEMLAQLMATTRRFEMETQPQLLTLQRSMVMAEGLALGLDPDANMWELSRPVLEHWVRENLSPAARAGEALAALARLLRRLPDALQHLEDFLDAQEKKNQKSASDTRDSVA